MGTQNLQTRKKTEIGGWPPVTMGGLAQGTLKLWVVSEKRKGGEWKTG